MTGVLGFTIQGRGGAIPGHGGHCRCWIDNSGGVPWSALAGYNFNLVPTATDDWGATTSGSLLLSDPFALANAEKLTVIATLATAHYKPFWDVGFALLVQGLQVKKILFALRPDNVAVLGDMGPMPPFAKPSAGVTVTTVKKGVANIVLGGVNYGEQTNPGDGDVSTDVTAVSTPGAGTYQVLLGMFGIYELNQQRPAALIVQSVAG
jgi:hypothetical protein